MISRVSYLAQRRISGKKEWLISDRHESLALYFANLRYVSRYLFPVTSLL